MACKAICRLCKRLVISQAVTFTGGNLVINLPEGNYINGEKYCIVVGQSIPAATTIDAPVVITIGTGTTLYPLNGRCCQQITVCGISTRTKYSTVVATNAAGGAFRLLGDVRCRQNNRLAGLDGGEAAPAGGGETA